MNVEEIRDYCLSFPAVEESLKWGDNLVFTVHKKMFCILSLDEVPPRISFKTSPQRFQQLIINEDVYIPAPYLAKAGWVSALNTEAIPDKDIKSFVKMAYNLIRQKLTIKEQKEIEEQLKKQ